MFFYTLEGMDTVGKTTQIKLIKKELTKNFRNITVTKEPGGTPLGRNIRKVLFEDEKTDMYYKTEMLLFLADQVEHSKKVIIPALMRGLLVISDRYIDSGIVYQGLNNDIPIGDIYETYVSMIDFPQPSITFVLDMLPKMVNKRVRKMISKGEKVDRNDLKSIHFHRKIRKGFYQNAMCQEERRFVFIDATLDQQEITNIITTEIRKDCKSYFKDKKLGHLGHAERIKMLDSYALAKDVPANFETPDINFEKVIYYNR